MPEDPATPSHSDPPEETFGRPSARFRSLDIDLGTKTSPSQARATGIQLEPYNPVKETDTARRNIAYWLLSILSGVVTIALLTCLTLIYFDASDKDRFDHLLAVINLIFGPLIALVGSATGFYFGSQSQSSRRDGGGG